MIYGRLRSERLLSILLLLQAHGRLPARALAERLEVSERTIHRDVEALSGAGVPVYAERGRLGGVALLPGYRTDVSGLTGVEAQALFIFAGRGTLADLGLERELKGALRKLMAALPAPQRPGAQQAQERVLVEPRGWMRRAEELPQLATIQAAVWTDRRLRLEYRNAGASESRPLTIDPYGLVSKGGTWYLVGALPGGEARLYRVSRVTAAEATDEPSQRPPNLDLEALWDQLRRGVEERGPAYPVRLRVRAERAEMLLRVAASQLLAPPRRQGLADGWATLELDYIAAGAARASMLSFADDVEVLEPAELRGALRAAGEAVARLYGT
jgi:predicted DNA-binding transcriptional regulator YafY